MNIILDTGIGDNMSMFDYLICEVGKDVEKDKAYQTKTFHRPNMDLYKLDEDGKLWKLDEILDENAIHILNLSKWEEIKEWLENKKWERYKKYDGKLTFRYENNHYETYLKNGKINLEDKVFDPTTWGGSK